MNFISFIETYDLIYKPADLKIATHVNNNETTEANIHDD